MSLSVRHTTWTSSSFPVSNWLCPPSIYDWPWPFSTTFKKTIYSFEIEFYYVVQTVLTFLGAQAILLPQPPSSWSNHWWAGPAPASQSWMIGEDSCLIVSMAAVLCCKGCLL
jgi:hypothetical protein